jgi:hypothetical protein
MPSGYPDWHKGVKADIIAQTLEKLAVDIVATTVGTLGIDIQAQTIDKLNIDIISQTISELTQRNKLGAVRNSQTIKTVTAGTETTVFSLTGKGYFIYALFVFDYDDLAVNLKFDNPTAYWGVSPKNLYDYGFTSSTPFMGLGAYTAGGSAVMYIAPLMPMSFESSFEISILNPDTVDHTAFVGLYYAIL